MVGGSKLQRKQRFVAASEAPRCAQHSSRSAEMSIATKRGDGGQTGLVGDVRVSKADLQVEAYGSVDELNSVLGFARSICQNADVRSWTESIQKTLFRLGSVLATAPATGTKKDAPGITPADVEQLTTLVHTIQTTQVISVSLVPACRPPAR